MSYDSSLFPPSLLQAINDWQIGGNPKVAHKRGLALKAACLNLPADFRQARLTCFRQIALGKSSVWDLFGKTTLAEKISSWTFDVSFAKKFKGGVPPEGQGFQGIIFQRNPPPAEVIVNLWALFKDEGFRAAVVLHKAAISRFNDGIGKYGDEQSEVVLEVDQLQREDVYSLGGHSSSFNDLVRRAAFSLHGRMPTEQEVADLMDKVKELEPEAGARWLEPTSTKNVLARIEAHAVELRLIADAQANARKVHL